MKVSIVVPNYNYSRYLDKRLHSILDQTYQDFEIIILDDASTDDSAQVLEKYNGESRVNVYFNEKNSGNPFSQWNKGVRYAQGEFVWIAEADDFCEKEFLQELVSALVNDESIGLAYCQSWIVDKDGIITGSWDLDQAKIFRTSRWNERFINSGTDEVQNYLFVRNTIPNASAVVFRRDLYLNVGGADVSYRACGDWITWARMLLECNIYYVSDKLNYHRIHESNVRQSAPGYGLVELFKVKNTLYNETEISAEVYDKGFDFLTRAWLYGLFKRRLTFEENKKIYKEASKFDKVGKRLIRNIFLVISSRTYSGIRFLQKNFKS